MKNFFFFSFVVLSLIVLLGSDEEFAVNSGQVSEIAVSEGLRLSALPGKVLRKLRKVKLFRSRRKRAHRHQVSQVS